MSLRRMAIYRGYLENPVAYMSNSSAPIRPEWWTQDQMYKKLVAILSHYCLPGEDAEATVRRVLAERLLNKTVK